MQQQLRYLLEVLQLGQLYQTLVRWDLQEELDKVRYRIPQVLLRAETQWLQLTVYLYQ